MSKVISLRPLQPNDFSLLVKIEQDPENQIFSGGLAMPTVEELKQFLFSEHDLFVHGQYRWVITYNDNAIGFADLFDFDQIQNFAWVGIFILNEFRELGFAKESLRLLKLKAREASISLLKAKVSKNNLASFELFKRAGYTVEIEVDGVAFFSIQC